MALYLKNEQSSGTWPEPIETTWQLLGGESACGLAPKLPHLGLADILFMSTLMVIPREQRPWGIVTWMAEMFALSRPALYALSTRVRQQLLAEPQSDGKSMGQEETDRVRVSRNRLIRTVLTASLPGKMAIRPLQQVLEEAFEQKRSIGWISELITAAGQQAGCALRKIDTTPLGSVIAARDETFFQNQPLLLIIDPVSTTILLAEVTSDRQADTWAAALLIAQEQGVRIGGLVEDMARMYGKSLEEAELDVPVQKDVWHIEQDGSQLVRDLERAAFGATRLVMTLEKQLLKQWDEGLFDHSYVSAVAREELLYEQHALLVQWLAHLADALELVDERSGEIRDRAINEWLLEEVLTALAAIHHPRIETWVKTLRRHQTQLLTSLDWLQASLQPYREKLSTLPLPPSFIHLVARHWRLQQALINGHTACRSLARQAQATFHTLLTNDAHRQQLADELFSLLNAACRTSSLIEAVNGLLKQFLHNHQAFRNPQTLQLHLNLFVLWHNMRVFERGKRQGKSPYQLAGIVPGTADWLSLLGYPAEELSL